MTTVFAFLFVIGVLVFVHELGHFIVAKWFGVRVLTFSVGFGPKLLRVRYAGTDYCLSAVPLGGYVEMAGERSADAGAPDEFMSKPRWQRCLILVAGPVMNIALAVVMATLMLLYGIDVPTYQSGAPVIGAVVPGSPAERGGMRQGDRILRVSDDLVKTWSQIDVAIGMRPNREVSVTVLRAGQAIPLKVHPEPQTAFEVGSIGVLPNIHPIINTVTPGGAADRAGVRGGDVVIAINGEPVVTPSDVNRITLSHVGRTIDITIQRDAEEQQLRVTPTERGTIGAVVGTPTTPYQPGPLEALRQGVRATMEMAGIIFRTASHLVRGELSVRQLMGPVGIAQLAGESARISWMALFGIMALISLNLGFFNLLPIPVLDGGHITMLAIEGVRGRDFTIGTRLALVRTGLAFLLVLMATTLFNDISRVW